MRRGWLTGVLALSVAFQVSLVMLPAGALHVENLGLLLVTTWATRHFVRRARELTGAQRRWRVLSVVALGLWGLALACNEIGLLAGASLGVRMGALALVAQLALACAVVTLLMVPGLRLNRASAVRMLIDGAAVGLSLATLAWAALFGVDPAVDLDAPGALALITLSGSLLVLLSAALPIMLGRTQNGPTSLGSFAGGIAVMAFGALAAGFVALAGDPAPETVAGGAMFLGTALIGRAALLPMPMFARRANWEYPTTLAQALPYLVLLALAVIAAVHQALARDINLVLTGMLFLLAVAVLTRQFLSLQRNARLAGELTRQRAQLAYQAFHDPLTGLANRTLFAERLEAALATDRSPSVLLVDLDGFKAVNDSRGHAAGDQLLVTVARRLRAAIGSADTVARMGGDEFAVLLPGGEAGARTVAEAILDRVARPVTLGESTVGLRVSIGIATAQPSSSADAVLRDADLALYRAKQEGKNQYRVADQELAERSLARHRLEEDLRAGVDRDEFEVLYRPIVEPSSERVVGAEAVLRWRHRERGLLDRAEFEGAAVAVGLLTALDRRVLETACADAAAWVDSAPGLTVTVPICAASVADAALLGAVTRCLVAGGIRPEVLELAVPAAALVADVGAVEPPLQALSGLGVRLAIADVGAGPTELRSLWTLPLRTLVLDRSLGCDPGLTRAVVGLAHGLGLRAVVTGVESRTRLRECGANLATLGAPVPADEFALLLPDRRADSVA
ncbi:putative bifunctional diguanylate cyclase/phosphodiesterase [Cryptosporangium aurantiacum]|uniref:Diguanylate cyclase (GGDEF) domain-containing protein n=1 Tax=Cryptosporangium aurantiacum TaxID=134849 RepID=A0A1M7QXR9_9ACTN|nr:diguanylate cyclase [Cryptosporangium aurantiacum]SHN36885.1 diguanylate cyclase (GGDEF) domain-containing protein [Cryptosporangium aurantiacum]